MVSPARRTAETWELASLHLGSTVPHRLDDRIYDNRLLGLLELIGEVAETVRTLAVLGHNPSIHELAVMLGGDDVGAGFPTATVAVFEVTGDWPDSGLQTARLTDVAVCRA